MGPSGTALGFGIVAAMIAGVFYMYGDEIGGALFYMMFFWIE
jgi:hypothetical protein